VGSRKTSELREYAGAGDVCGGSPAGDVWARLGARIPLRAAAGGGESLKQAAGYGKPKVGGE